MRTKIVHEDHLDAELIAAWADGALDLRARAAAEAHAADCTHCQAVLAAMIRAEPPRASAAGWRFMTPMRWAVPFVTAAAAAALWVMVPREVPVDPNSTAAAPTASRSLHDASTESSPAGRPSATAPPVRGAEEPSAPRAAESPAEKKPRTAAPRAPVPPAVAELTADTAATPAPAQEGPRPEAFVQAAVPAPAAQSPSPAIASKVTTVEQSESRAHKQAAAADAVAGAAAREFSAPGSSVRWRVGAGGAIQRSTDAGKTWAAQRSGVTMELLAASAPSADVCWIVGRAGVVLVSVDGVSWLRLPFPEAVDLTSVAAESALTASVATGDGRMFRTDDGGRSWTAQ